MRRCGVDKVQHQPALSAAASDPQDNRKNSRREESRSFFKRYRNMDKRWRLALFTTALIIVGTLSLVYSSRALADLIFYPVPGDGLQTQLVLRPDSQVNLADAGQVIARRLDQLNLSQSYQLVVHSDYIKITLPDTERIPYVIDMITRVGEIEFIDGGAVSPPLGQRVETGLPAAESVYPVLFDAQEVDDVVPPDTATGQIFYRLVLSSAGAERMANFVENQPDHYVCMVIDRQVINCSSMYHWGDQTLDILPSLGSGAVVSLNDLALFIESGPLPVPLNIEH
jgi:hypothetical protein